MLISIAHNAVADDAPADEADVLVQVQAVAEAIQGIGHQPIMLPITLDIEAARRRIVELKPVVVFNLVEALGGTDRLSPVVPLVLDTLGIPYTGNDADALYITNSKRLTKELLAAAGIPTPAAVYRHGEQTQRIGTRDTLSSGRFLIKAVHEHASFGMDDGAVMQAESKETLAIAIQERERRFGKPFFAEQYVDGREFNLSVLDRGDGSPDVLPPAEITFDEFPPGKPHIVGYAAKWEADSFEFVGTPRRFDFPEADRSLLRELQRLAAETWRVLRLRGYARVDFRVDETGRPYVIEANANPCLSPDAGFAAALANAGITFEEAVRRMIAAADQASSVPTRH